MFTYRSVVLCCITLAAISATSVGQDSPAEAFDSLDVNQDGRISVEELRNSVLGYHLIVGPKGSPEQLLFNTAFHTSTPIDNVPYSVYESLSSGELSKGVEWAVPYCLGDSYRGFRVVGTTNQMLAEVPGGYDDEKKEKRFRFKAGRNFRDKNFFEAVLGAIPAAKTGAKLGDDIVLTHGLSSGPDDHFATHPAHRFKVVGILEPTKTAYDRAVYVNMEGFLLIPDHLPEAIDPKDVRPDEDGRFKPLPKEHREVTAILVRAKGVHLPELGIDLPGDANAHVLHREINDSRDAQAISPQQVLKKWIAGGPGYLVPAMLWAVDDTGVVTREQYLRGVKKLRQQR